MRSVPFSLWLCVCGAHGSLLQCDVDGVAAACAFVHVLCGGLLFLSHDTVLLCGEVRGTERGWLPTAPRTLGSFTHMSPHGSLLQHRGRGLRGWEGVLQPQGQRDAVHDGEADPRVVAAHAARAPVRVGRRAHDWGEVAAQHCGAVCVVRGGGMPAIVRDVVDTELLD
ncbi:elongation factor 1-gamma (EF-1-gamma), partial [Trypanosoma cruzi]